jgi:hypothetical protein
MRSMLLLCCALSFSACAKGGEQAGGGEAAAVPTLNLADVAGKWSIQAMAEGSDSVLVTYELNAAATAEGWTMVLPGRDPVSLHVVPGGDSVVIHAGPYESVLRPGVTVSTESASRLVNGQLQGWSVARYRGEGVGADSVLRVRLRGTRTP